MQHASSDSPEVVALLQQLLRFDTTNWGGGRSRGEREAAGWIADQLTAVGLSAAVLARHDAPDRSNVVLRVPGEDPSLPALLVHAHLDVVPAEPDQWSRDPFGGELADGCVWGRGAHDMKDMAAITLATLLRWGRTGRRPRRDVVVAFVADEEDRGELGADFLVREHPQLFTGVEAAIGESGGAFRRLVAADGRSVDAVPIATAERGTMHLALTATGRSGHASRPTGQDAVGRLLAALHRLADHRWPVRPAPSVAAYLAGVASAFGLPADLSSAEGVELLLAELGEAADVARFTVRASSTPTVIAAGYKVNVIPGTATAEVDVRCPPGYEDEIVAELERLIGPDVAHTFTSFERPVQAPVDGPWFAALRDAVLRHHPGVLVLPYCMGGGTDAKAFSRLGIACYGFAPLGPDPQGRTADGVHGVDEHVPVASLVSGAALLGDLLDTV